ncbi:M56 family metallopeptidase [Clostridium sp. 'deep sea']|uniref:M56 family metallopeptidase n=1 Tax=Clostridium sp. 'deep sea' TaxID=2779445 RepID=UPI001FAB47EC|nr:M56 family metallopeptidase [Clostridium sp. 'deep sea']
MFQIILTMSFSASIVIIIILAIRQLLKHHLSKTFIYSLWALVLLRLLLPVSIESNFSIFNIINLKNSVNLTINNNDLALENDPIILSNNAIYNESPIIKDSQINSNNIATDRFNHKQNIAEDTQVSVTNKLFHIVKIIWLFVMCALFLFFLINYIHFYRLLIDATKFKDDLKTPIYMSDKVDSPIIHGLINPKIIIPSYFKFNEEELGYIIAHEQTHLKRLDHLAKPVSLLLVCIHWFNPLVWLAFFVAMKDMELSCDEKALRKYDKKHQTDYAKTLLKMSIHQNHWSINPLVAFGEKNIKSRVKSALNFKHLSGKLRLVGLTVIVVLTIVLISDANKNNKIDRENIAMEKHVNDANDILNSKAINKTNSKDSNQPLQSTYRQIQKIGEDYGYENTIFYSEGEEEITLLAYNTEFTKGLLIYLTKDLELIYTKEFKTNEALSGFDCLIKYGDFRNQDYLLATIFKKNERTTGSTKIIGDSKIVAIPKDDLSALYVLGEYVAYYQAQGEIPTSIDFTLTISGDYIAYCDVDSYFKVQHIKTGDVYVSNENTTRVAQAMPVDLTSLPVQSFMPIVEYQDNSSYLFFNRDTKEFVIGTLLSGSLLQSNTIDLMDLSTQLAPLNNYLCDQDLHVEEFYIFKQSIIVFYDSSKVLCYDLIKEKVHDLNIKGTASTGPHNVKRLNNDLLAVITADKLLLYDEVEKTVKIVKDYDSNTMYDYDISSNGTKLVYTTASDELFVHDLITNETIQVNYKKDFETNIRGIKPVFSMYDNKIAFIVIGNQEGQTLGIIEPDYSISYTHIHNSLESSLSIKWLRDGSISYISDYSIAFLSNNFTNVDKWQVYKEIELYENNEILPTVSVSGRYILYQNQDRKLERYDCITGEIFISSEQPQKGYYQFAELLQVIVGSKDGQKIELID